MFKATIEDYNNMEKTVIYNDNKIEIGAKPFLGEGRIFYNDIPVEAKAIFGNTTCVFVAIESNKYVQYEITIRLRWHFLGFYTIVKRQDQILYSDK
jgi:hypothetical protein